MRRVLGLDIGSNSIGWALIERGEDAGRIVGMGVRVFPEGVGRDKQGAEHSKNEQRRIERGMRRQIARRSRRKRLLKQALVACDLYPADEIEQIQLERCDPYQLRSRAVRERLEPHEIGRVLVHLNQRRGFLSNRKTDKARKKQTSEMLTKINELAGAMGERTLGEHFGAILGMDRHERVRGKHTRRDMYENEFEKIWETQKEYHPDLLTEERKYGRAGKRVYPRRPDARWMRDGRTVFEEYGIHGILFFQRAIYWPRSVIGECEYERRQPRCPRADREAQRFRMLLEVNNLRIQDAWGRERGLTPEERTIVLRLFESRKEVRFDEMRKSLRLHERDVFNLQRGGRDKLKGLTTDALLSKRDLFGTAWRTLPEERKNAIVRSLIEDEEADLRRKAREWGFSAELTDRLVDLGLEEGYMSLSRVAIRKLLPYLEQGMKLMGNDASDSALHAAGYLRPDERVVRQSAFLPQPPSDITNPIVRQALHEVRKLVNAIIREWGKPELIHIELARETQGGFEQRKKYTERMRMRERARHDAAEEIREWGIKPTGEAITRYLLWQEQSQMCFYSGKPISHHQLFGGEVDVDHILPYSRSLDDSMQNKVVCFLKENREKGNRTPHEWLAERDPEKYEAIKQRADRLPIDARLSKLRKVAAENVELEDFIARQLTDTAYITRQVHQYVRCLNTDVVCTKGQSTATLRHHWGLDQVLRTDGLNLKNREDHRHHAVDALVVALTDRSMLQTLARMRFSEKKIVEPWDGFRDEVQAVVDGIHVSHKALRKIHGALHEETIYGPTQKPHRRSDAPRPHAKGWVEDEDQCVIRKKLEDLTAAMMDDIRDPRTRELVLERFERCGKDLKRFKQSLGAEPLRMISKRGADRSPTANIIKTVRVLRRDQTIQPIRKGTAWVKPGSTHHICLFELPESTPERPKRVLLAVSMLEAAGRARAGKPIVQKTHPEYPQARFLYSLSWGEMVQGSIRGRADLYCFRTAASTQGQIYLISHVDARQSSKAVLFACKASTLDAVKIQIDVLGRFREATN
jgi:CRISPR-associated endonuclease Csn1